jgi:steroid delta-isomerase-like uncharacterized protein
MLIRLRWFASLAILAAGANPLAASAPEAGFVHDYYDAFAARDAARLAAFYAPGATFDDPSFGLALRGADQIRGLLVAALAKYESLDWSIEHVTRVEATTVVEGIMTGKVAGRTVHIHFVSVFTFADGRIAAQRDLYDVLHFYAQLGVTPPEFRTAPKPGS